MSRIIKGALALVFCSLVVAVPSVRAGWIEDGIALTSATEESQEPAITSDCTGGAIVTWYQYDAIGGFNIYAQRTDASGTVMWDVDGVAVCTATDIQQYPKIASDGAGGAIITWYDYRNGNNDIYAQRIDPSGTTLWAADGIALCSATGSQAYPTIISDGAGGAIVTWMDFRGGSSWDIYTQRVNASGVVQWGTDGVAICTAASTQDFPAITSDGMEGAVINWRDYRDNLSSGSDIYAQRVNAAGAVQWTADGVAICTAVENQLCEKIISDDAGGAILAWSDPRSGATWPDAIYAQRVDAWGVVQWGMDGLALISGITTQRHPALATDGAGGAIVAWSYSSGTSAIYAQRVDPSGTVQWAVNGIPVSSPGAYADDYYPAITSDGAGGAIVAWLDLRNGNYDIYAQRIDGFGSLLWDVNDVAICTDTQTQHTPQITSDCASGAIVTWEDLRAGNYDIYAQLVDQDGEVGTSSLDILSVEDIPSDQGGWVRITVTKSKLEDNLEACYPVSMYNVWQRIDDPFQLAMIAGQKDGVVGDILEPEESSRLPEGASNVSGLPTREIDGRCFLSSRDLLGAGQLPPGTWELLGSFSATQQEEYLYRASTLADSTESGITYSVYIVSAHTTTPSVWFVSDPDSGYSVDNIPPDPPLGLVSEQSFDPEGLSISWDRNTEDDISHYAVYRGISESFIPEPGNCVAEPVEHGYFDDEWSWDSGYYYKVSAVDVNGNESEYSPFSPSQITGEDIPAMPKTAYLGQNYPNPFNPFTAIEFELERASRMTLSVYDAAGRLVRVIIDEDRPAGHYKVLWDGKDGNGIAVSSAVYFYRLETDSLTRTKKMILLR